ncbi:hypothetical protein DFQ00_12562 [Paenibacillus barcinonensis]|uniref:Uncharacterized protein n=1 Tax=Paenibacillus barcinonensis TaxID=198119 RepID=A0A2V4VZG6_PAEBA|nr:hypothetical protein DFQ00_12562 [Paenibacillus barcinonensis]
MKAARQIKVIQQIKARLVAMPRWGIDWHPVDDKRINTKVHRRQFALCVLFRYVIVYGCIISLSDQDFFRPDQGALTGCYR